MKTKSKQAQLRAKAMGMITPSSKQTGEIFGTLETDIARLVVILSRDNFNENDQKDLDDLLAEIHSL